MNKLLKQAEELLKDSKKNISLLSNIAAFIYQFVEDINWVGFYLFIDDKLYLGPFQGKIACNTINLDEGVCGYAFSQQKTINVANVDEFKGHIACDPETQSELVIPLTKNKIKIGVLDVDSKTLDRFDKTTILFLENIANIIIKYYQL